MDSFELNKIIGAFLGVVFVVFSVSIISDAIFAAPPPETPGYAIEVPEGKAHGGGAEVEAEPQPIGPLLAEADPSAGENIFKRCQSCHTVEQGGANKVGPNLWDIVNRPIASREGFGYSGAMQEFAEGEDGTKEWTYERLDHYLTDPRSYVSGTAMAFAGLSDVQDRADVIAYLRQHADEPAPLPEPEPEPAESAEAGDEGAAAEGDGAAEEGDASGQPAASEEDAQQGSGQEDPAASEDGADESAPDEDAGADEGAQGNASEDADEDTGAEDDAADTEEEPASDQ